MQASKHKNKQQMLVRKEHRCVQFHRNEDLDEANNFCFNVVNVERPVSPWLGLVRWHTPDRTLDWNIFLCLLIKSDFLSCKPVSSTSNYVKLVPQEPVDAKSKWKTSYLSHMYCYSSSGNHYQSSPLWKTSLLLLLLIFVGVKKTLDALTVRPMATWWCGISCKVKRKLRFNDNTVFDAVK